MAKHIGIKREQRTIIIDPRLLRFIRRKGARINEIVEEAVRVYLAERWGYEVGEVRAFKRKKVRRKSLTAKRPA